jgi:hypothetical protein
MLKTLLVEANTADVFESFFFLCNSEKALVGMNGPCIVNKERAFKVSLYHWLLGICVVSLRYDGPGKKFCGVFANGLSRSSGSDHGFTGRICDAVDCINIEPLFPCPGCASHVYCSDLCYYRTWDSHYHDCICVQLCK